MEAHPAVILRFGCGRQVLRVDPEPNQLTGFPVRV
jgi:hypothetical protein